MYEQLSWYRDTNRQIRGAAILDGKQNEIRQDGYSNLLNKYGTPQDNSTAYYYQQEPIVSDYELITMYEGNGLFSKIIDRPSEEAVKHGLDIDFGNEDTANYVEEKFDELEFEHKFAMAEKWARLYGGSIIVMLCDDGRGLDEPLDEQNVKSVQELRVYERAIVQEDFSSVYRFYNDPKRQLPLGQPEFYIVNSIYGSFVVHYTRCLVFRNGSLPEQTSNSIYRHWGIPEYVKIKRELRECMTSHSNGTKLLERSVQAIYKMKNLANLLSSEEGENKVLQRLQVIDMARGILNSMAIDAEGEDYDFKSLPMSGVKDVIDSTCNMLSAVTNIPQTILFGRSPSGMNSTGESDLENYYNMVENIQKQNMKANARTIIDLILRQGLAESKIDEIPQYKVKFNSLWSLSESEQVAIEQGRVAIDQAKAQTAQLYIEAGVLDPSEVRSSLAKEGDFSVNDVITEEMLELPEDTFPESEAPIKETEPKEPAQEEASQSDDNMAMDGDIKKAASIIVINDGKILCGERTNGEGLCGPGGHIKEGETPEYAVLREAQEEFDIVPLNILPLGQYIPSTRDYCTTEMYFTDSFTGKAKADEIEMANERWLTLEELDQEQLYEPFAKSLELLKNLLTASNISVIVRADELSEDGGPGSGNFYHSGRKGKIGGSSSIGVSPNIKKKLSKRIVGFTTSTGVEIKSISSHAFDRIGSRKISVGRIEKTLISTDIEPGHTSNTEKYKYNGGAAIVDNTNGKLVTYMWTGG